MLIYHVDANSAYLSWTAVNLLRRGYGRDIRQIPSAIAGDPGNRHGVILAKSIPAKKYGVRTGESLMEARKKCPGLEVHPPDHELYHTYSDAMYKILCEYTPVIQRYSIDECYCDMTSVPTAEADPVGLACKIKDRIKNELRFTVNVGIGENKVCAKMAGEFSKPDKVHTLWPCEIPDKLWPLPVGELFMAGRASVRKLESMGIFTIGDLAKADKQLLKSRLKSHGILLHDYANGIDNSKVTDNDAVEQKGISKGLTYKNDLLSRDEINRELLALCEKVSTSLRKLGKYAGVVAVYIRDTGFAGYSHQIKLSSAVNTTNEIFSAARKLVDESWKGEPVRAMSVSLSELSNGGSVQLSFFDTTDREKEETLDKTIDRIREEFGDGSIFRGTLTGSGKEPGSGRKL